MHPALYRLRSLSLLGLALLLVACSATFEVGIERTPTPDPRYGPDCRRVRSLAPDSAEGQRMQAVLLAALPERMSEDMRQYAPFTFVEIWAIDQVGDWAILQGRVSGPLEPAAFVLKLDGGDYRYDGVAWAGIAQSRNEVGNILHLSIRAEYGEAPPDELTACPDFSRWSTEVTP